MKIIKHDMSSEGKKIKGSRFIGYVFPIHEKQDIVTKLAEIHEQHPNASHVCYAWILSDKGASYSDDGEPTGSAGRPILQHLEGRNITNVLGVSVRYFGGTKLGVGGLIRAYGDSIASVLDMVELQEYIVLETITILYDYDISKYVQKIINNHSELYESMEHQYLEQVCTQIHIPIEHVSFLKQQLIDISSGRIIFVD